MRVANGVEMLEISATVMGRENVFHPTLLWDAETAILVDAGVPGQLPLLRSAMEQAGVPFDRLGHVIVTHQDLDHIGSLPAILQESPQRIQVWAHALEKPYIQGEKRLLKMTPEAVARALESLPPEVSEERRQAFKAVLENSPKAHVNHTLAGGEELPFCGGLTVIDTPGHTPGHISLYHQLSKTLIAGDALTVDNGQLLPPNPQATLDEGLAIRSLQTLAAYDIEAVICYHGGLYTGAANARIAELAAPPVA